MSDDVVQFSQLKSASFAIAYRMLGSVSEAEDIVQESLLRISRALDAGEPIESPRAYIATITTRLAINELRSARARRERYVGAWLPEPIITSDPDELIQRVETVEALSLALLVLLETLSPEQRAVLLLHDVFDYDYRQIAAIVSRTEENVRQLAARARRRVAQRKPRFQTTLEQRDALAQKFFGAVERGDLAGLEEMLASDVELSGDGGGKAPALSLTAAGTRSRRSRSWRLDPPRQKCSFRFGTRCRSQRRSGGTLCRHAETLNQCDGARNSRSSNHQYQRSCQP